MPKTKLNGSGNGHAGPNAFLNTQNPVSERERLYARAALDGCADELAAAPKGTRNDVLNRKSFRLGTMAARGWITRTEVVDTLFTAAATCGLNADDGEEATRKTLEFGLNNGEKHPHPDLDTGQQEGFAEPPATRRALIAEAPELSAEWPEPISLPDGLPPVDAFSSEFLPASVSPWVDDIAERLQCPPDYVAVAAITALGSVIGRRIGVRPQLRTDWTEVPNLWGLFIGRPGMLKSPAMGEALRPIHRLEAEAAKDNEIAQQAYAAGIDEHKLRKAVRRICR